MSEPEDRDLMLYRRELDDGYEVCVYPMLWGRARLCYGEKDAPFIENAFCYDRPWQAIAAARVWDGKSDPLEGWTRNPMTGRRRPDGDPTKEHTWW